MAKGGMVSDNMTYADLLRIAADAKLRDIYVGLAMHALLSRVTVQADAHYWIAQHACEMADALLAEREKRQG